MSEKPRSKSACLQELIHRRDKILAVLHPPTAAHARIMEKAGCEALFVGTGGVVGAYTGLADVGTATMTECVTIAGWIADSVSIQSSSPPIVTPAMRSNTLMIDEPSSLIEPGGAGHLVDLLRHVGEQRRRAEVLSK
jgi:hypothetical protein